MKQKILCWLAVLVSGSVSLAWADDQSPAPETDGLAALVQQKEAATSARNSIAAPVAIPSASAPVSKGHYVVQVGAFTHIDQATKWQEQLAQEGIQVEVQPNVGEYGVVRVRSLPLQTKAQAQDLALQMKLYGVQQALIMFVNE